MVNTLKLPVGIDSFEKIRRNGFYYIDKTNLIEQILMNWGEVTLFTRPRRFGKTLNMSMLKSFFEIGADAALFEGLYIANNMWREMYDFSPDAVLMVLASEYYDEKDYIRNYDEFMKMVRNEEETSYENSIC